MEQSEVRPHQPGQDAFKAILSEDIDWKPFPAFPSSVRLAVVVGQPSEAGPYTIRVKVPHGEKLMPHKHQEDRVYTVISGVFYIGLGDEFDASKLEAYPPGVVSGFNKFARGQMRPSIRFWCGSLQRHG